ncbi:MAG: type II toxin-antitoxin system RelE/ParE family toxin [Syntrophobacteraceae bacterium]
MRKITFHEEADSEIQEAALYYEERFADLGFAFLDETEKTSERILAHPGGYQRVAEEVRQALVARFPYSILYVTR